VAVAAEGVDGDGERRVRRRREAAARHMDMVVEDRRQLDGGEPVRPCFA
jgi:hypothetical protein